MSPVVETNVVKPSLLDRLNIVNIILALVLSIGGGAASVWWTQANTTTRLTSIETLMRDRKADRDKEVDNIRAQMVTRSDFEALLRALSDIREDIKEIRAEQLRQARERR